MDFGIDRVPIGDIGDAFFGLTMDKPAVDHRIVISGGMKEFALDYRMTKKRMGDVPLYEIAVCTWIKETIKEGKLKIFGGILDEIIS